MFWKKVSSTHWFCHDFPFVPPGSAKQTLKSVTFPLQFIKKLSKSLGKYLKFWICRHLACLINTNIRNTSHTCNCGTCRKCESQAKSRQVKNGDMKTGLCPVWQKGVSLSLATLPAWCFLGDILSQILSSTCTWYKGHTNVGNLASVIERLTA